MRFGRRFRQVDVFGDGPYLGNPVAVVLDGEGLSAEEMGAFTRWTNLSEATFVVPAEDPAADYRVRIFTLGGELPFAGHPTLGTCHAWIEGGGVPARDDLIVQECGVGLVAVKRLEGGYAFAAPPLVRSGPLDPRLLTDLCSLLGLEADAVMDAAWVDNGPGWIGFLLQDADTVLAVDLPPRRGEGMVAIGLVGLYPTGSEAACEVRALFTDGEGMFREDPVTGSLNASLAQWLISSGRLRPPYLAAQGTRLGRRGRIAVFQDDEGTIWIGGNTYTCVEGVAVL